MLFIFQGRKQRTLFSHMISRSLEKIHSRRRWQRGEVIGLISPLRSVFGLKCCFVDGSKKTDWKLSLWFFFVLTHVWDGTDKQRALGACRQPIGRPMQCCRAQGKQQRRAAERSSSSSALTVIVSDGARSSYSRSIRSTREAWRQCSVIEWVTLICLKRAKTEHTFITFGWNSLRQAKLRLCSNEKITRYGQHASLSSVAFYKLIAVS